MITVLPPKRNLGTQFGQAVGGGIALGAEKALESQQKQKRLADIMSLAFGQPGPTQGNQPPQQQPNLGDQYQAASQGQMSRQPQGPSGLNEQQLAALFSEEPELAKFLQTQQEAQRKQSSELASRHFDIAKPTLLSTAERAEALPQKESALQTMQDAIKSGNLGFFTKNNLAEITGIKGLASPEGAVFKTAGKEFFLGSLKRAGARPNQWIEQQISEMLPLIGRRTEANLSVTEALRTELDVEKKQIELTNQIADEMEKSQGFVGRDLSAKVMKQLTPYAIEKQKELKDKLQSIKDTYEPANKQGKLMYAPDGSLRRISPKDLKDARKEGYRDYE